MTQTRRPDRTALTGAIAALLALFVAACQPQGAGKAVSLEDFRSGEFSQLDFSRELSLPVSAFVDADGNPHTFEKYKGKVVVYNLWAEWCAPCVEEMPSLAALQKAFDPKDVVVVPVAAGKTNERDSANAMLKRLVGEDLPFYYDDGFNVNADAETGAFPSTIIYDRSGREVVRLMRPADWGSDHAIRLVRAVLEGAA